MLTGNKNFGPATFFANDSNYKTATSTTGASKKALKRREIEFVSAVSASEALRHRQPSGRFQLFLLFSKFPRARMHSRAPDIFPDFRGAVEAREKKKPSATFVVVVDVVVATAFCGAVVGSKASCRRRQSSRRKHFICRKKRRFRQRPPFRLRIRLFPAKCFRRKKSRLHFSHRFDTIIA